MRDVAVRGVAIPEGSTVAMVFGSANRDEDEFPGRRQLPAGPGAEQARRLRARQPLLHGRPARPGGGRAALNGLLDRYAGLERAEEPAERLSTQGFSLRGFGRLPIRFHT